MFLKMLSKLGISITPRLAGTAGPTTTSSAKKILINHRGPDMSLITGLQIRVCTGNYFLYFSSKTYVVGTQKNRLNETVLLSTQNTCLN